MMTSKATPIANPLNVDESKLVEKFIQGSNQLLSSDRLRLEVIGSVCQLTNTKSGEPIAMMYLQGKPRTAIVKQTSPLLEQIDAGLLAQDFVCFGASKRPGFVEYKHFVTPAGYRVWYTEPAILWKKWWPSERFHNKQRFNMNILINIKDNWYPVRNMTVHGGRFTIETIAGTVKCNRDESVLWIAQVNPEITLPENSTPEFADNSSQTEDRSIHVAADAAQSQLRDKIQVSIEELQQRLETQQQLYAELEEKLLLSQQLTNITEKRLEIVHRYLAKQGISLQDVYQSK
jgi:hypothetical protein